MSNAFQYRVRQFFHAITADVKEADLERAQMVLPPDAHSLFCRQSQQDQKHALAVFETLSASGHQNPDLLAAALLHDVGKAALSLPTWQRAIIVLLEHYSPRILTALSQGEETGWRKGFSIHARHGEIGASWAAEAGCSVLTTTLIRRHHEPVPCGRDSEENRLLMTLQAADGNN